MQAVHTAEQAVKVDISNGEKEFEDTLAEINGLAADMSRVLNHHESKSELFPLLGRIEAMLRDESGMSDGLFVLLGDVALRINCLILFFLGLLWLKLCLCVILFALFAIYAFWCCYCCCCSAVPGWSSNWILNSYVLDYSCDSR